MTDCRGGSSSGGGKTLARWPPQTPLTCDRASPIVASSINTAAIAPPPGRSQAERRPRSGQRISNH